jgi:hypothetical protein
MSIIGKETEMSRSRSREGRRTRQGLKFRRTRNLMSLPVCASSRHTAHFSLLPHTPSFESRILFLRLPTTDIVTLSLHYPRAVLLLKPAVAVPQRYSRPSPGVRQGADCFTVRFSYHLFRRRRGNEGGDISD